MAIEASSLLASRLSERTQLDLGIKSSRSMPQTETNTQSHELTGSVVQVLVLWGSKGCELSVVTKSSAHPLPFTSLSVQPTLALAALLSALRSDAGLPDGELAADECVGEARASSDCATLAMDKVVASVAIGLAYRGLQPLSTGINGDLTL